MSVKIAQKDIKFFSELFNGYDFTSSPTKYTDAFSAPVMERCKSVITIDVNAGINISNFQILYEGEADASNTNENYKIVKDDAAFLSDGIILGSQIALSFDPGDAGGAVPMVNCYFIVDSVTDNEIFVTYDGQGADDNTDISLVTLFGYVNSQANTANPTIYNNPGYIAINPEYTALEFSDNLVENSSGSTSMVSRLTGVQNSIKVTGVPTTPDGSVQTGVVTSKNKAASMGVVTVEFKDKIFNNNALLQLKFGNRYEITHEFVVPWFLDGEEDSLEDTTTPPDIYKGTSSPKYIYETRFFRNFTDPNTSISFVYSDSKGNAGYFDEAFNGDENPYSITNLVYTDTEDNEETDRLQIGKNIKVNFDVENSLSDFDLSVNRVIISHGAVIESGEYSSSEKDFSSLWVFDTVRGTAFNTPSSRGMIKDMVTTFNSTSSISIEFNIEFSNDQNTSLEEDQYYVLSCQLSDFSSNVQDWHKTNLKIDYNQYGKNSDIDGLFGVSRFEQIPHPIQLEDYPSDTIGYTNGQFDIEEGGLSLVQFWLDTSKEAVLDSMNFQIGVYDTTDVNNPVFFERKHA